MAFIVEYVMTRPDTTVEFPELTAADESSMAMLRTKYGNSSSTSDSSDSLVRTLRSTGANQDDYTAFYNEGQILWESSGIVSKCADRNIAVEMDIIENT